MLAENNKNQTYPKVMILAGSDSGGCAGIQADIRTVTALGGHPTTVITALTAQNTMGVEAIYELTGDFIYQQANTILTDIGTDAIKIGMLFNENTINVVADILSTISFLPSVLDPVMVATTGASLISQDAKTALINKLFPLVKVITPNKYEAEVLVGNKIENEQDMLVAAKKISELGVSNVVITGGDSQDDMAVDYLYDAEKDSFQSLISHRISTKNTHGSGCTFSSAIALGLALGLPVIDAVNSAKLYTMQALEAGAYFSLGRGSGPLRHYKKNG